MSTAIQRIAILGAESTGKSTLAAALATHFNTIWVPEYLREFVDQRQRTPHADEQFMIARTQLAREQAAISNAQHYLFCDTAPLMTAIYSEHYFGLADAELNALAATHNYAETIVTAPTTPWIPDGLQRESESVRQLIHAALIQKLQQHAIPYLLVEGTVAARQLQVARLLKDLPS